MQIPLIESVNLYDATRPTYDTDTTDEMTVAVRIVPNGLGGPWYKMFLTQRSSDLSSIRSDMWTDYSAESYFTFTGFSPMTWMKIHAVLKDSAGNVSVASVDSIFYDPRSNFYVDITRLRDIDGPDMRSRFTDSTEILVTVDFGRDVDSIDIWDDRGMMATYPVSAGSEPRDSITIRHTFRPGDGPRLIYAHGRNPIFPFATDPDSQMIILDTVDSRLRSISVRDISTGYDPTDTSEASDWALQTMFGFGFFSMVASDDRSGHYILRLSVPSPNL
jgi:hypothetical protein